MGILSNLMDTGDFISIQHSRLEEIVLKKTILKHSYKTWITGIEIITLKSMSIFQENSIEKNLKSKSKVTYKAQKKTFMLMIKSEEDGLSCRRRGLYDCRVCGAPRSRFLAHWITRRTLLEKFRNAELHDVTLQINGRAIRKQGNIETVQAFCSQVIHVNCEIQLD